MHQRDAVHVVLVVSELEFDHGDQGIASDTTIFVLRATAACLASVVSTYVAPGSWPEPA